MSLSWKETAGIHSANVLDGLVLVEVKPQLDGFEITITGRHVEKHFVLSLCMASAKDAAELLLERMWNR